MQRRKTRYKERTESQFRVIIRLVLITVIIKDPTCNRDTNDFKIQVSENGISTHDVHYVDNLLPEDSDKRVCYGAEFAGPGISLTGLELLSEMGLFLT